jgi:hypothetical protein
MKIQAPPVTIALPLRDSGSRPPQRKPAGEVFSLAEDGAAPSSVLGKSCPLPHGQPQPLTGLNLERSVETSPDQVAEAYRRADALKPGGLLGDMGKYKDDQLLRNPGGDAYDLRKRTVEDLRQHGSFSRRIGKDLSDAWENAKRFFQNLAFGSELAHRDASGKIRTTRRNGLLGSLGNFLKNTASALTLGLYTPEGESKPSGLGERVTHFLKKTKEALLTDLVQGVPSSVNRMGKNLILAGWNLAEVFPDATLGHLDAGRKTTTTVFDNGQVLVEYLTDVIPGGDAWLRVHAGSLRGLKAPIVYNLSKPEHSTDDMRWDTVRNTPFRKTIETLGALLADAVILGAIGQTLSSGRHSEDR